MDYTVEGSFNWLAYRAEVAAIMLPHIYQHVLKEMACKPSASLRDPADIAIEQTINITIDMTKRLETRLKGGEE